MNLKAQTLIDAFSGLKAGSVIVEIGCVRFDHEIASDGFSTVLLGEAAKEREWLLISIDNDPNAVAIAQRLTAGLPVIMIEGDGAEVVANIKRIDGLFLDGSADPADTADQYEAAKARKPQVVVIDDAQPIEGRDMGKAADMVGRLVFDGFEIKIVDTEPGYRMLIAS